MEYKFSDLIDLKSFKMLMKQFYNISKLPYGILDLEGNILGGIGWQDICTKFHRIDSKSNLVCKESDTQFKNIPKDYDKYIIYKCPLGLMDICFPIVIDGIHMANLFWGQFLLQKPDLDFFKKQGEKYNYNIESYLEALTKVPIYTEEEFNKGLSFYIEIANYLAKSGESLLKIKKSKKELEENKELIKNLVFDSSLELKNLNENINKSNTVKIQSKINEIENRFYKLLDISPISVVIVIENRFIYANNSAVNLIGAKTVDEIKKTNPLDVLLPKFHNAHKENLRKLSEGLCIETREYMLKKFNKGVAHVEASILNINYKGKKALLIVSKDISSKIEARELNEQIKIQEKQKKEAQEYEKMRTEFFSNLSHEIITPINLIYSTLQLLELELNNDDFDDTIKDRIKIMTQNCYRLMRLTNNLIDTTKIDAGFYNLKLQNCNIISIIEDIVLSVSQYIKEKKNINIVFDTNIEEIIIAVDPSAFERIILNLLSNAVKFSNNGGYIYVSINVINSKVMISIRDDGVGIPKDQFKIIFDRFRQVDKSFRRSSEGSGIGLSIVKSLVSLHNGTISVKSQQGNGTEFIITLPANVQNKQTTYQKMNNPVDNNKIEKISIEFSDIYNN